MTQKDLLQMYFNVLDLQVGDVVQITHKVPAFYLGVSYGWNDDMDKYIGKTYQVKKVKENHIGLHEDEHWCWHPACLKVVSRKPKDVTITFGLEQDDFTPMFSATVNANTTLIYKNGGDLLCELDFYTVELIFKHMNKLSGKMLLTRGEE